MQTLYLLLLGLLVSPHRMLASAWASVAVALTLMFLVRPLAVWLCLAPMCFRPAELLFVGWVGLRGAVPIVLALFPLLDKVQGSERFFNVAFAVVLASLLLQTFGFFQLPVPDMGGETLRDWLTDSLARDAAEGDGVDRRGARFGVGGLQDGRIARERRAT